MQAKIGTRYIKERTKLETVIPLDTPFVLFIDPASVCNLGCKFCPCGNSHKDLWSDNKKTNIMSYELFRKIVDDAKSFNGRIKTLRLYKEGEPLMNPRLPDMISYAKKNDISDTVDFTTNGVLLKPDLSLALIDAGLDRINISVEALTENDYYEMTGVRVNVDEYINNIRYFYEHKKQCHVFIKILDNSLNGKSEQDFYDMFGDYCDEIAVEHITHCWPEFELDSPDTYGTNIYGEELTSLNVCPHIFYTVCINSNGSVSLCFVDWNHKLILGDVNKESIVDIWNGDKINDYRIKHLQSLRKEIDVCSTCGQIKFAAIDNIDAYSDVLLERVKNRYKK